MSLEQPKNPEQKAEKPYVAAAREVVAKADMNAPGTTERFLVIDSYVDQVLQAADRGEITGSVGTYTRDQLLLQFGDFLSSLHQIPSEKDKEDPYLFIPGKDGIRASFKLLMESDATYRDFEQSLKMHLTAEQERRAELLSQDNIQEMGEVEVAAAGIEEPIAPLAQARRAAEGLIEVPDFVLNPPAPASEQRPVTPEGPKLTREGYLDKLTEGFSDSEKGWLRSYAEAVDSKQRAQREDRGDDSIYWEQQKGQIYRIHLSPRAQAIASRYAQAYNHY